MAAGKKRSASTKAKPDGSALSPRQQLFVDAYVKKPNITEAAIAAGFSPKTAASQGSRLLKNVKVSTAIQQARKGRSERTKVDQDYVLGNLTEVVERCMQRAPVMVREGREMVQAADEDGKHIWAFNAKGAVGGLSLLGKHLGMFVDKHEHTGKDGGPIQVTVYIPDNGRGQA